MIYLNDDIAHFDWQAALPMLSEQRRQQCLQFKFDLGRKTCAAAYLLLCQALQQEYGIMEKPVFCYGEHGKPAIEGHPEIHFNLSHCREAALCVVSDRPVGVDIESIDRYKETVAQYTMNEEEMALIHRSDSPAEAFVTFWTQKEAVLKLRGTGITDDMKMALVDNTVDVRTVVCREKNYIFSIAQ